MSNYDLKNAQHIIPENCVLCRQCFTSSFVNKRSMTLEYIFSYNLTSSDRIQNVKERER